MKLTEFTPRDEVISSDGDIDKSSWGDGPWQSEPDRMMWADKDTGLICVMLRNDTLGHWCGYVGVPASSVTYGAHYDALYACGVDILVHGGLTYSGAALRDMKIKGRIWFFGFDCAHAGDLSPGMVAIMKGFPSEMGFESPFSGDRYCSEDYVREQLRSMAWQLNGVRWNLKLWVKLRWNTLRSNLRSMLWRNRYYRRYKAWRLTNNWSLSRLIRKVVAEMVEAWRD